MSRRFLSSTSRLRQYVCASCRYRFEAGRSAARRSLSSPSPHHDTVQRDDDLLTHLTRRGLINQIAGDRNALSTLLQNRRLGFYAGIDPTAPSLHLGHLLPLMVLFWTYIYGHKAVSLVGGATARVGDPSGRLTARENTGIDVQRRNFDAMFKQVKQLWRSVGLSAQRHNVHEHTLGEFEVVDNAQWLEGLGVLEFLKTLGHGMRVGTMLGRDTVRNKMEKGDGMSFSEFTYPLLQGYDWWHMFHTMNVQIQIGGSDQYGNIIAGIDAVKFMAQNHKSGDQPPQWFDNSGRLREALTPMGLTVPLLTTASGEKFGKSAGNAIWLDPSLTSPFDLYGFLLRTADADVERYLKIFTFVPLEIIARIMHEHAPDPGKRRAQHLLASEVLTLVHSRDIAAQTQKEHSAMRNPGALTSATNGLAGECSKFTLPTSEVIGETWAKLIRKAELAKSNSEATRLIAGGGVFVANRSSDHEGEAVFERIVDPKAEVADHALLDGKLVVRLGKWKVKVIEVTDDVKVSRSSEIDGQ